MAEELMVQSELNSSTEIELFNPTPHMEKWLNTAIEIVSDSPKKIAEESGIDKSSWYKWLKDVPGFEQWYYASYKQKRQRWIPTLDRIGMKQAERGDYNFWKDMRRAAGEVDTDNSTKVQINNIIGTKRGEYGF